MPGDVQALVEQVRSAAAASRPLRIRGGDSKRFYGEPVVGEPLETRGHSGIVSYVPSELVVTARAGTPLSELEEELQARGQMLAFEPPHFGLSATVGGMVAAGLAGPRRLAQGVATGSVRDSVLGARLLDGRGEVLTFGGQVVKNVAGYDVSRLLAGSRGTLGVLLDVSLRVVPRPTHEETRVLHCTQADALKSLQAWRGKPWPVSAVAWRDGLLWVRLSGAESAVSLAASLVGGDAVSAEAAAAHWRDVRELAFAGASPSALWRLNLPAGVPPLDLPGDTLIEWLGQRRWLHCAEPAARIRACVAAHGGHATRFRGGDPAEPVFPVTGPVIQRWEEGLRRAFDPHAIFNQRGRHADAAL